MAAFFERILCVFSDLDVVHACASLRDGLKRSLIRGGAFMWRERLLCRYVSRFVGALSHSSLLPAIFDMRARKISPRDAFVR
jgi:hypothetical protein